LKNNNFIGVFDMKFGNKNKDKKEKKSNENDIEIVFGENSDLELDISDVGDYMNDLRPKNKDEKKKEIVIPKAKKDKNN